jgi:hypothetical protein
LQAIVRESRRRTIEHVDFIAGIVNQWSVGDNKQSEVLTTGH